MKPRLRVKKKEKKRQSKQFEMPYDEVLFAHLRERRKTIADELGVPPYIVFGDVTLVGMAQLKPQSLEAMLEVSGVGQVKLERFGQAFLQCIQDHT